MQLNQAIRQEIIRNATMKKFIDEQIKLEKHEQDLFVRAYNAVTPLSMRHMIEKFRAVEGRPNIEWFKMTNQLKINVAGQTVLLQAKSFAKDAEGKFTKRIEVAVPYNYYNYDNYGILSLDKHEKLVNEIRQWQGDSETLKKDKTSAEATLKLLLKSVRTTEKLVTIWPEGKKFFASPPLVAPPIGVPAVQMQALNEMLGLT